MTYGEFELITASEDEKPALKRLEEVFSKENGFSESAHHSLPKLVGLSGEIIEIPLSVFRALQQIVGYMLRDKALSVVPYDQMVSTQEAADMLNVSKDFLVKLLESGVLPFTEMGTNRLVQFVDLLQYKNYMHRERRKMLAEIANISQEAGEY